MNNNKQVSAIKKISTWVCCRAISLGVIINERLDFTTFLRFNTVEKTICSMLTSFTRAFSLKKIFFDICSDLDSAIVGNSRNYLRILRGWLSPVARSVNSAWKRCWRASVNGWAASTFHSRCDGKGPTVTIIKVGRYIFGGYTSVSWGTFTE